MFVWKNRRGATRGSPARMVLNRYGTIIVNVWKILPNHHPVKLDVFQIMPNHVHFVIVLTGGSRPAPTLGTIIGLFKSQCAKQILRAIKNFNIIVWQKNYYETVIRNENDLNKIRGYIRNNIQIWDRDRNNPLKLKNSKLIYDESSSSRRKK